MSIYDVGIESLPNVYFDKIKLDTNNGIDYTVTVSLVMYDSTRSSWFGRPEMQDMKIRLLMVHDYFNEEYTRITTGLNEGNFTLYMFGSDGGANLVLAAGLGYKVYRGLAPPDISSQTLGEDFIKYGYSLTSNDGPFRFENISIIDTNNITLYAAVYLDGLSFTNPSLNRFYGPMASELVLRNGLVNRVSGYFYFPDTNKEYSGPVHYHPSQGYMIGSTHEQFKGYSHRKLRYVQVENTKIESIFP